MFMAERNACAAMLTSWWKTVGRLAQFLSKWMEATLIPIYKKGDQSDPGNYRLVSFLTHARKTIDATLLTYVCEPYNPTSTQVFQPGISVQQAILKSQANAQQGLGQAALLHLTKAYDRVNWHKILSAMAKHLEGNLLNMVGATLGPWWALIKGLDGTLVTTDKGVLEGPVTGSEGGTLLASIFQYIR